MLTPKRLRELLHYDHINGIFTWTSRTSNRVKVGNIAGNLAPSGYIQIMIDGRNYTAHRLAFLYMIGEWPEQVDHKDMNRSNNAWDNLRPTDDTLNLANRRVRSDQKSSLPKGVYRNGNGYCARIQVARRKVYLGQFASPEAAATAYREAAERYFGEFARTK